MADAGLILDIEALSKYFTERRGLFSRHQTIVKAVDQVTLAVRRGEVLGLVGESGCGKTTLGRTIARLYRASAGRITYFRKVGEDAGGVTEVPLHELEGAELRAVRRDIQVVFQDPISSLNARWDVRAIVAEPLLLQGLGRQVDVDARVTEMLRMVGLSPDHLRRFPHEFSGGQRQRIGIARALALEPKLVIADEPVSALDVSIQAQVLNLIEDLQRDLQFSTLFVAHDLLVVQYISDRIAVMYLGRIVELAATDGLFEQPLHPYSEALLSAVPVPAARRQMQRIVLGGDVPSPAAVPAGCPFHPRCRHFQAGLCDREVPELRELQPDHWVACLRAEELNLSGLEQLLAAR